MARASRSDLGGPSGDFGRWHMGCHCISHHDWHMGCVCISHHNWRDMGCVCISYHNWHMDCVCIDVLKTPVAALSIFRSPTLSKRPLALANFAFSGLFATAASKALAHGCVVREFTQTSEEVAG